MLERKGFFGRLLRIAVTLPVLWLVACATSLHMPAITESRTDVHQPGKFVWHDLLSEDVAAAKLFYGGLFGWTFESVDIGSGHNYTIAHHRGRPVAGIVDATAFDQPVNVSQWIGVLSVEDVDQAVALAKSSGGTINNGPLDLRGRGRFAVISDPQGALVTLLRSSTGDPSDTDPANGDWLWNEVWTDKVAASAEFYSRLAGYTQAMHRVQAGWDYHYLTRDGIPRAGILQNPVPELRTTWLPYIKVDNPKAVVARVPELGGKVLVAPQPNAVGGQVALVTDPTGAGFLIQTWTPPQQGAH